MAGMTPTSTAGGSAGNAAFKNQLNKVYTWYTGGFIAFIIVLAILEQQYGDVLGEDGLTALQRTSAGVKRMTEILDRLLGLSVVSIGPNDVFPDGNIDDDWFTIVAAEHAQFLGREEIESNESCAVKRIVSVPTKPAGGV